MENDRIPLLERAGEVIGFAREYVEKRIELYQLQVAEKIVQTLSSLITYFLLFIFFILALIFASVAAGFFLATALGSSGWGFAIVTGFYTLLAILLFLFRRPMILDPVLSMVLQNLREEDGPADGTGITNKQNQPEHGTVQGYSESGGSAHAQSATEGGNQSFPAGGQ